MKKYKIPVDRAGLAGWASCLKDSLCLGMGGQAGAWFFGIIHLQKISKMSRIPEISKFVKYWK